jgi:glucose dehydrogenase
MSMSEPWATVRRLRWFIRGGAILCCVSYWACHRPVQPEKKADPKTTSLAGAVLIPDQPHGNAAEWPTSAGDYANTRYSPLDAIRPDNVKQLQLA